MIEVSEVISLFFYLVFFSYLVFFVKFDKPRFKSLWFYGVIFFLLSLIFTITENLWAGSLLNSMEHISTAVAAVLFLAAIIRKEL